MRWNLTPAERFWAKVDKSGECWLWTGWVTNRGYGCLHVCGRDVLAHRFSFELEFGPFPHEQLGLHHCDNPPCVRPYHLFLGTAADNTADMIAKGRHGMAIHPERVVKQGEAHGCAVLTNSDVLSIRSRYRRRSSDANIDTLAAEDGVTRSAIFGVVSRRTWAHLP